jgi:hypothetical protein
MKDRYWEVAAERLAELFSRMPDVKPSDLDADPQRFLANYKPAPGSWDERTEASRQYFTEMDRRLFQSVYAEYRGQRDQSARNESHSIGQSWTETQKPPEGFTSSIQRSHSYAGTFEIPAAEAKMRLMEIADQIVSRLVSDPNATGKIVLEISAKFDEGK